MTAPQLPTTNAQFEQEYLAMVQDQIDNGFIKTDRTGTGTLSKFANVQRVDISDGKAPLLYSKEIRHKGFVVETVWFKDGGTDIAFLKKYGVGIWDEWVIPETAVFQEYSSSQLEEARKSYQLIFEHPKGWRPPEYANVMSYKDLFNYYRCTYPDYYKNWKKEFPTGSNLINLRHYIMNNLPAGLNSINDIPNVKLSGGSIGGGAYGSLWRHWEDTRIVQAKDAQIYYDRGYSYVADVPLGANWKKQPNEAQKEFVVVHREIDQLANVIKQLRTDPMGRRIIVSAWNPGRTEDAALPPCHSLFSFYVRNLSCREMQAQFDSGIKEAWLVYRSEHCGHIPVSENEDEEMRGHMAAFCKTLPEYKLKTQTLSCLLYMR